MKGKLIFWTVIVVLIAVLLSTGVYQVGPSEVALVKTFGKYVYTSGPGIHFHLPFPFQSHVLVDVASLRKIEIGFRTIMTRGRVYYQSVPSESLMITGDGNIVSVEAVIQYKVSDPVKYAFSIINDEDLVRFTTESVLRENVAMVGIDDILTVGRDRVAMETAKKVQKILNDYGVGIKVENVLLQEVTPPEEVLAAFDDVNNAKQDKERAINEARKYANDVVPKAEGEAQKILREAEAYANEVYLKAKGEAERFLKVLAEYSKAPQITKKRMLLETLKEVIESSEKIVDLSEGTIKILNLNDLLGGGGK